MKNKEDHNKMMNQHNSLRRDTVFKLCYTKMIRNKNL